MEDRNKEVLFSEELEIIVDNFGQENQEGMKEALRNCQETFGCVSRGHQKEIGQAFAVDEKLIKTIIRFMPSIKESIVEYELVCCTGSRCASNGSIEVLRTIKEELGLDFDEVSQDGRIRLSSQNCFKKCNLGPNLMLNGRFYHHMDREKARELVRKIKSE